MRIALKTVQDVKDLHGVKSFKHTPHGLVAIRQGGLWHYYKVNSQGYYEKTGTTRTYCRNVV